MSATRSASGRRPGQTNAAELRELQEIPGIGPSLARDLRGTDPEAMYRRLIRLRGVYQDRCVLYVFRCATYFASRTRHDPERLKWWNWSDANLARRGPRPAAVRARA
jgi:hypothetical protein